MLRDRSTFAFRSQRKLKHVLGNLLGSLKHVEERTSMRLVRGREERPAAAHAVTSASAANPVHIVFYGEREGVINDVLNIWQVHSARSNVRRHQQMALFVSRSVESFRALSLAFVAVQRYTLPALKNRRTGLAGQQRELKQKLSTLLKEEAHRMQRVRARRTVVKLDEKQVLAK